MQADPDQRPEPRRRRLGALVVRNLQRRHTVDGRRLRGFLEDVAEALDAGGRDATLALVADARIQELNREFRGLDKPTDVLSFPFGSNEGEELDPGAAPYLGDIVISVETADRQARRRSSSLDCELRVLTLHGFLHLLGYDHENDDGEMRRIEYRLRRRFGITRPRARATPAQRGRR